MVFLAITPAGLAQAFQVASAGDAIWCGAAAITEVDFQASRDGRLTRFDYEVGVDDLECALDSVREHHPGQMIWVEAAG